MRYLFIFLLLVNSTLCISADEMHRQLAWKNSLLYAMQGKYAKPYTLWISPSTIRYQRNTDMISTASGQSIFANPGVVASAYDAAIQYNVSHFYTQKKTRYAAVFNLSLDKPGRLISIGYDSGFRAEKISIAHSFFLGFADSYKVGKNHFFTISAGSWFGGSISESPCYDDYSRAYTCSSLTAWDDYHPQYPRRFSYIDIKYNYSY